MKRFSAQQLADYLTTATPRLIDVREPWEHKICHIDNSQLIPMRQIPSSLELFDSNEESVIICHHGIRSLQVCHFLAMQGIHNTINLDGGIEAWARDVDIQMATY